MTKKNQEPAPQNNNNHMSQNEVAIELGISRSKVDSIEKMAIRKIKSYLKNKRINIKDLI